MAIITPIGSSKPVEVAFGGTGVATLTGIVSGNGTSAFVGRTITGTTNQITITNGDGTAGNPTVALAATTVNTTQPAFLARLASDISNVTGDGTVYTIIFDTEEYDQGGNFNLGTSTFTAPVAGKYLFCATVRPGNLGSGHTSGLIDIVTTTRSYETAWNPFAATGNGPSVSILADMAINDTATLTVTVSGSTKTVSVVALGTGGTRLETYFSGFLAC